MAIHNLLTHPKLQTAPTEAFCSKERVKDYSKDFMGYTRSRICDGHSHGTLARLPIEDISASKYALSTVLLHGIHGIPDEVIEHLLNFALQTMKVPLARYLRST